jgi:hypothetical protein
MSHRHRANTVPERTDRSLRCETINMKCLPSSVQVSQLIRSFFKEVGSGNGIDPDPRQRCGNFRAIVQTDDAVSVQPRNTE